MKIYALRDPRTTSVRYIGKAKDPQSRYRTHTSDYWLNKDKTKKNSWIKSLKAKGFQPELIILDEVTDEQANEAEVAYIGFFGPENLTNGTLGGDGGAVTDPEAKERIRQAHLGSKRSDATRARMSAAHKSRCSSPEERQRMSESAKAAGNTPPVKKGEANNSKLTENDVRRIRCLSREGLSPREIWNKEFQFVTYQNVWLITSGRAWKHVT
jgi:hypothetical protein